MKDHTAWYIAAITFYNLGWWWAAATSFICGVFADVIDYTKKR